MTQTGAKTLGGVIVSILVKVPLKVFPVPNLLLLNFKVKKNEETSGVR